MLEYPENDDDALLPEENPKHTKKRVESVVETKLQEIENLVSEIRTILDDQTTPSNDDPIQMIRDIQATLNQQRDYLNHLTVEQFAVKKELKNKKRWFSFK